jgi:hypothetical protein
MSLPSLCNRVARKLDEIRLRVLNYESTTAFVRLFDGSFYFGATLVEDVTYPLRKARAGRRHGQPENPHHRVLIERNEWGHCARKMVNGRIVSYACAESQTAARARCPKRAEPIGQPFAPKLAAAKDDTSGTAGNTAPKPPHIPADGVRANGARVNGSPTQVDPSVAPPPMRRDLH